MRTEWVRSDQSSLVLPAPPPPPPPPPPPREYLLVCPRCHCRAKIGAEHESMYKFTCKCGGGNVKLAWGMPGTAVIGIEWNVAAPLTGTCPRPWEGY